MSNPNAGNTTVPTAKNTNLTPNVQMGENATGVTAPATLLANGTSTRSVTATLSDADADAARADSIAGLKYPWYRNGDAPTTTGGSGKKVEQCRKTMPTASTTTTVFRPVQKHQLQTALKKYEAGDLSKGTPNQWDVTALTDMSDLFANFTTFNAPIHEWDMQNVTTVANMFCNAKAFNQPLAGTAMYCDHRYAFVLSQYTVEQVDQTRRRLRRQIPIFLLRKVAGYAFGDMSHGWNLSRCVDTRKMFYNCKSFNHPIETFDTSHVTNFADMFMGCTSFNQPVQGLDTSKATTMAGMFNNAPAFNQPIEAFDTSNVANFADMFAGCTSFNQPVQGLDTSKATTMAGMFSGATVFNQPIEGWNTSNVTDLSFLFYNAVSYNRPVEMLDTSRVATMASMFNGATSFNHPIEQLNTARVTNMGDMFVGAAAFNQPIANLDLSQVCRADAMFMNATSFNQPIEAFLGHLNLHTSTYGLFANNAFDEEKEVALRRYRRASGASALEDGNAGGTRSKNKKKGGKGSGTKNKNKKTSKCILQ